MPTLGRPTETGDTVPLFDFDTYFLGKWTFEWSMPEIRRSVRLDRTRDDDGLEARRTFYEADQRRRRPEPVRSRSAR